MTRAPAQRIQRVQPPATLAAGEKARQLARLGHDVIDLGQSSPHHVTPQHIIDAGIQALNAGHTNISSSRGLPELRQAMTEKLAAHNGRAIDPDGDILVTPGSKMGLYEAINAYIEAEEELTAVAQLAQEQNLLVLCDETYEYFLYDGNRHVTVANLEGMAERTLTSYTFTKAYSMSGWRLGCIVGQSNLLEPLLKIQEQTASFVSPFVQMAGVAALEGPQDHLSTWRDDCDELRVRCVERLSQVPGVHCPRPEGATFLFPRYSADLSSTDMAELLVEREGVVVTPGIGFGASGEGHFRIALMRSPADRVWEGVERIARALESL